MPSFEVSGATISYSVEGNGPPVLLIMGLGTPSVGFVAQVPAFRERHRTIVFDNRGSGRSSSPPGPYTIRALADDALALLDRLDVPRAHVVGVSMGGMIAQEIAIEQPERVGALVIASSYAAPGESIRTLRARAAGAGFDSGGAPRDPIAALRFLTEVAFTPDFIRREGLKLLELMAEAMPHGPDMAGLMAQVAAVLSFDARPRLGRVRAPTLVLTGDADRLIPAEHSEEIARLVPGARLERIPGGSHAVNFEAPEAWNRIVLDFLATHGAALGSAGWTRS
jgi:3-oxoadipate enol-lactonase